MTVRSVCSGMISLRLQQDNTSAILLSLSLDGLMHSICGIQLGTWSFLLRLLLEALHLDGITYSWRYCNATPIPNSAFPMCVVDDTPRWGSFPISGGMLTNSVKQGKPLGYEAAMKLAGFTLPSSVADSDHSILQPLPVWISYEDLSVSAISLSCSLLYQIRKVDKHRS
jgi:hypothetical protein